MKKSLKNFILSLSLLMMPVIVWASSDGTEFSFFSAFIVEAFISVHVSFAVLIPLSQIIKEDQIEQKKMFWKLFWIRVAYLVFFDMIIPEIIMMIDIFSIFVGAFVIIPIYSVVSSKQKGNVDSVSTEISNMSMMLKCPSCGIELSSANKFCVNCGAKLTETTNEVLSASSGELFDATKVFGYNKSEDDIAADIIKSEIGKSNEKNNVSVLALEKKKNKFVLIYAIILFICLCLWFFHSHTGVLLFVFVVITMIFINSMKKYNIVTYLQKEVKARPDEKISYVVSSVLSGKVNNSRYKVLRTVMLLVAVVIPMFLFKSPHIIYEAQGDDYVIRFYTIGWLENDEVLEIPAQYKGKDVVGIRGDVFANVKTIRKVILPDTIQEIRGGAFTNAKNLEEINLPEGIPEIKAETFQGCESLKEITIPDSVTRIAAHAFREDSALEKVNISENSKLTEIGSSAFRECYSLTEIYLPSGVTINERAFKDSGTNVKKYTDNYVSSGSTSSTIVKDDYEFKRYLNLVIDEPQLVNAYQSTAVTQGYYIELIRVEQSRKGYYTYELNISHESGGSHSFVLFEEQDTYVDNEYGIMVKCIDSSYFTKNIAHKSIEVNVYFN